MGVIRDELTAIAGALGEAGIPATLDTGKLWPMAAQSDVVALVGRPEGVQLASVGGSALEFTAVVWLVSRGPDREAAPRLLDALPDALGVLLSDESAEPDRWVSGDASMLAYRLTSPRIVTI